MMISKGDEMKIRSYGDLEQSIVLEKSRNNLEKLAIFGYSQLNFKPNLVYVPRSNMIRRYQGIYFLSSSRGFIM